MLSSPPLMGYGNPTVQWAPPPPASLDGWASLSSAGSCAWTVSGPLARSPGWFYTYFMAILNTLQNVLTITENPFFITKL